MTLTLNLHNFRVFYRIDHFLKDQVEIKKEFSQPGLNKRIVSYRLNKKFSRFTFWDNFFLLTDFNRLNVRFGVVPVSLLKGKTLFDFVVVGSVIYLETEEIPFQIFDQQL